MRKKKRRTNVHFEAEHVEPHPVIALYEKAEVEARRRGLLVPVAAVTSDKFAGRLLIIHESDVVILADEQTEQREAIIAGAV